LLALQSWEYDLVSEHFSASTSGTLQQQDTVYGCYTSNSFLVTLQQSTA
jgi:hypothetical protein